MERKTSTSKETSYAKSIKSLDKHYSDAGESKEDSLLWFLDNIATLIKQNIHGT